MVVAAGGWKSPVFTIQIREQQHHPYVHLNGCNYIFPNPSPDLNPNCNNYNLRGGLTLTPSDRHMTIRRNYNSLLGLPGTVQTVLFSRGNRVENASYTRSVIIYTGGCSPTLDTILKDLAILQIAEMLG